MAGTLSPDDVDSIGDSDIAQILGLSKNASQQEKLAMQQRLANALRLKEAERGQSVPGGAVFIPPNPATTAMDTFDHLQGIMDSMKGKDQGNKLDDQRQSALEKFASMWFGRGKNRGTPMAADPNDPNTLTGPPQDAPQQ